MRFNIKIRNYISDNYETIKHYYFPIIVGILAVFWAIILTILGEKDLKTVFMTIASLLMAVITVFYSYNKIKQKNLITNLSLNFLLDDEFRFDYLLNFMIGRKPKKMADNDATDILFNKIEEYRKKGDVEMNRRITEALPALYYLSRQKYWNLVENLREDYDPIRWKSDNRRRVIESFDHIINSAGYERRIFSYLVPKQNDELLTSIASVEILAKMKTLFGKKRKIEIQCGNYISIITNSQYLNRRTKNLLWKEWNLLYLVNTDIKRAKRLFENLANSKNIYEQIIVARNFRLLCNSSKNCLKKDECQSSSPDSSIYYYYKFLDKRNHKNVRRPLAKEYSLECLVLLLQRRGYENIAKELIWKLLKDEDDIIRITAFDKIYRIKEINPSFANEIITYLDVYETNTNLKERISYIKKYKY